MRRVPKHYRGADDGITGAIDHAHGAENVIAGVRHIDAVGDRIESERERISSHLDRGRYCIGPSVDNNDVAILVEDGSRSRVAVGSGNVNLVRYWIDNDGLGIQPY